MVFAKLIRGLSMLSESLREVAGRFFNAVDPAVLLGMPGCDPVVANEAHDHYFGRTLDDRLDSYLRSVGPSAGSIKDTVCYCERVSAILALQQHDCVFEQAFRQLETRSSEIFSGIEFHLVGQNETEGSRLYSISRIHARRRAGSMLEVRIIPVPDLTVDVRNVGPCLPPREWHCTLRFGDDVWFQRTETIDSPPGVYAAVDTALERCRASPSVVAVRRGILRSFRDVEGAHIPPSHLIRHLFRQSEVGLVSDVDVRMLRERLLDANVLRSRMARQIERRLANHKAILEACSRVAAEKVVRLLRCTLPLASLETADTIAGVPPALGPAVIYRTAQDSTTRRRIARRVFLCHAAEDKTRVRSLYASLTTAGVDVWFDEECLGPGQEWDREIVAAIRSADFVLVCLSRTSTRKVGYVNKEIRFALDAAEYRPLGSRFLIPVLLEECEGIPAELQKWQWIKLFEPEGQAGLLDALSVALIGWPIMMFISEGTFHEARVASAPILRLRKCPRPAGVRFQRRLVCCALSFRNKASLWPIESI